MTKKTPTDATKTFEEALKLEKTQRYVLRLYVTGTTPRSMQAIRNIKMICEEHLKGRYDLEVIDLYQQPVLTEGEQILAAPTLIKQLPEPLRKFIGDMSNTEKMLVGLDLRPKEVTSREEDSDKRKSN